MGDIGYCNNPETKSQIAGMLASGMSQISVAEELNISRATVCRAQQKPEVKDLINQVHQKLIQKTLNIAQFNISRLISDYYKPYDTYLDTDGNPQRDQISVQRKDHGFKASIKLLESVGVFASHTPQSILIQQIYNDNRVQLSDSVVQVVAGLAGAFPDDPLQDDNSQNVPRRTIEISGCND